MRYLMLSRGGQEPDEKLFTEMAAFIDETTAKGILLTTGGLLPGQTRVARDGGEVTVTDGPFTEAKEAIGGFALVDVRSKDEAIELARRFLAIIGEGGESLIHEVAEA